MIKVGSLFSGKGAFEKALEELKTEHEINYYCENDKFASYAYSVLHNISESKNLGDIKKVNPENLGYTDLTTYGFCCQDISLAGERKGIIAGKTRSGLVYEALKIIDNTKPRIAIGENVRNLVSKMFYEDFENIISILDDIGYNSYWKVVNSKDHLSVQSRERVFIVSIRKDIDDKSFEFPEEEENNRSLSEILEKSVDEKYYCKDNMYLNNFIDNVKRKIVDFKNPSKFGLLKVGGIENPSMQEMNRRVFSDLGLCPTILTGSDSTPKVLTCRVRRMTPLECWRANGFTDEDYWKVRNAFEERFYNGRDRSDSQMYKLAGNSIVRQPIQKILKVLIDKGLL